MLFTYSTLNIKNIIYIIQSFIRTFPMFKFSDAAGITQTKISRNNILCDIFDLCQKVSDCDIKKREKIKQYYEEQKQTLKKINDVEILQSTEYTEARQTLIQEMMNSIGDSHSINMDEINNNMKELREQIDEKISIMKHLQTLIPQKGIATNYAIHTGDENQSCATAARFC